MIKYSYKKYFLLLLYFFFFFFFSSRRRHTRFDCDWSSDVCSFDLMEIPWASSRREFNALGVNMLLYAETLKYAVESGVTVFDLGRSSIGSGTYKFKKQWGASERQLY